jgi:hypothetical protein
MEYRSSRCNVENENGKPRYKSKDQAGAEDPSLYVSVVLSDPENLAVLISTLLRSL